MSAFVDLAPLIKIDPQENTKSDVVRGGRLFIGVNCIAPGHVQAPHTHEGTEKVYVVLQGRGRFTVGEEIKTAGPRTVVFAPPGILHGVTNEGHDPLVLLVAMAPPPSRT